jgi:hypothetical protein
MGCPLGLLEELAKKSQEVRKPAFERKAESNQRKIGSKLLLFSWYRFLCDLSRTKMINQLPTDVINIILLRPHP